jgi:RHS repeat-associated protein
LGHPGQYYDEETNNYYNYFRDYDPTTGRYLQRDPIGLGGGLNSFTSLENNPMKNSDVMGLLITGKAGSIFATDVRNVDISTEVQRPMIEDPKGDIYAWYVIRGDVFIVVAVNCHEEKECDSRSWTIYPDF